ncbi:MAG: hypothetical protein COY36_02465 [Zetaproteobacteria bacterium CG_4_10_14_0_2_um_filter_55_20]|nr:MAG: hypothetical protein COZ01_11015 [Zetaproteobacteria bacterium CG_4_10_14_0_8_um_filter_55_43]PIZ39617.1 MAG: hypothetical protein COY36_02465 [Zetaproteobacteria bacterium CG_4_10_14_0_2_um_filter_55_20]
MLNIYKPLEGLIDKAGWRGPLRKTPFYFAYKFIKALPMVFDYRMVNLYSRELFRKCLRNDEPEPDVYSAWLESFQFQPESPLGNLQLVNPLPWMYIKAVHFMEYHLLSRKRAVVFEWGSGTSTIWFSKRARKVFSTENNGEWYSTLRSEIVKRNINNVEMLLKEATPDQSNVIPSKYKTAWEGFIGRNFRDYVTSIDDVEGSFDLILIDGVCRQACLEMAVSRIKPDGLIVLDNSARPRYQSMIKSLEETFFVMRVSGPTPYGQGDDETTLLWPRSSS